MAEKSGSTRHTRVHSRDRDFTLYVRKRGMFTILAPVGRHSDTLLASLAEFLQKPDFIAVDLSKLDAVSLPLVRAFSEYASGLESGHGHMVLVRPPDKIRALLKLVDRERKVTVAVSDRDLDGNPGEVEDRVRRAHDRGHLVRTMLETNPCWQLADAEGRWLCPFCVTLRPGIHFIARGSVTQRVVDGVATHLDEECSTYADGKTDGWPFEVLERVLSSGQVPAEMQRKAGARDTSARRKAAALHLAEGLDARRRHLLLPDPPKLDGCEIGVYYSPVEELSGDFFDFIRLPGGRMAVVVGDISPGGVDPGVLMGMARKVLRIRLAETGDIVRAIGLANDDFCDDLDRECYVTATVAVIDGPRREMKIARAGHAAPFLLRGGSPPVVERLALPGPLLGLVPTATFEEEIEVQSFALNAGDLLLLHTDGLEELRDRSGEMFGADRIASILNMNAGSPAEFVLGAAVLDAEQFVAGSDRDQDMTAVCVRFR
ncbi:MAG TPA: SpoIIE family protein phosphatase [Planctomycetota bacterium]|nr:SpoIIE family protein phosphatase [Planctomycetota bacterium]